VGAVQTTKVLAWSNLEPKIRSLGLIPSNIEPNYQLLIRYPGRF
jgi:hypothetical protein